MKLDDLLLTKEEIPIFHKRFFIIPIFPLFLREDIHINPELASRVFPQATQEWHEDLTVYTAELDDKREKEWIEEVFLVHKPEIEEEHGYQVLNPGFWKDMVNTTGNGFATCLSIDRDAGGTLYLPIDKHHEEYIYPPIVNFSKEKFEAYKAFDLDLKNSLGVYAHVYEHHNIDHYPGALFLRNWSLLYLNEALKEVDSQLRLE